MRSLSVLLPFLSLSCGGAEGDSSDCTALCGELVTICAYEAFPSLDSCMQGCLYNEERGALIDLQLDCVQVAQCDTFSIVECEHVYGID
ncbi:MAG TPA: hypothetical protein ENK18_00915 [Deltaproteobacteria bacterium]|nr:hypothetical protein [Deltaproteobacteria bacterium]